jgi:hypothetical protein
VMASGKAGPATQILVCAANCLHTKNVHHQQVV